MERQPKVGDWVFSLIDEEEGVVVDLWDRPDCWGFSCTVLLMGRDTPSLAHVSALQVIRRAEVDNENL